MKHLIIIFITALFTFSLSGCGDYSPGDLFTPKSVRTVRGDDDEKVVELRKKASKYEKLLQDEIKTSEDLSTVYKELGDRFIERKNWNQAIQSYEKSIGYGSRDSYIYHQLAVAQANRGENLSRKKDYLLAEKNYRKSISLNKNFFESRYGLGILLYYRLDKKREGARVIERITIDNSRYYPARFVLGRINYHEGKLNRALAIYESLYADLKSLPESSTIKVYKKSAETNIDKIMKELSR